MRTTSVMALVCGLAASGALAQSSPYYLTNGDGHKVVVVQGGSETNRWDTGIYSYPIAVSNGQVRVCDGQGFGAAGLAYDLNGNFQGNLQQRAEGSFILDSTSDGTYNYYSNNSTLFRTDLDWGNATPLFGVSDGLFSITYDSKRNYIWTTGGSNVNGYDLGSGQLVAQFSNGNGNNCGLGYEPATDSLWMYAQGSNLLRQYDAATGNSMGSVAWNNPFGDNVIGGEFEIGKIPAPGAAALFGIGGLLAARRRR